MTKEQIEWFNALPCEKFTRAGMTEFSRTCPCGASILYELANTMVVNSWIECHYGHQTDNLTPYKFEYDFSRPIKFTLTGFNLFYQEFDLSMICSRDDNIQIYKDKHNRQFVFYMNHLDKNFKKFKDLYATFLPTIEVNNV